MLSGLIKVPLLIKILVGGCRPHTPACWGACLLLGTPQPTYLLKNPLLKLARDEGDPNAPEIISVLTSGLKSNYVLKF